MKTCSRCKDLKEEKDYSPSAWKRRNGWCRECMKSYYTGRTYAPAPEGVTTKFCNEGNHEVAIEDFSPGKGKYGLRQKCRNCENTKKRKSTKEHPEEWREKRLQYLYGISQQDYLRMLQEQDYGCAICGRAPKDEEHLCVDHDHKCCTPWDDDSITRKTCGKCIRGLLCMSCNRMLGRIESGELDLFYDYLLKWNSAGRG